MERLERWVEVPVSGAVRALAAVSVSLAVVSWIGRWIGFRYGCVPGTLRCAVIKGLDVDREHNVPTWWSGAILLVAALLAAAAAAEALRARRAQGLRFGALAALLALASLDEIAALHERINAPLRHALGAFGEVIHNAWAVAGLALAAGAALALLPLARDVSPRVLASAVTAVAVYCSGALGMELVDGVYSHVYGEDNLGYASLTTVEELLEMLGVSLLVGAFLVHLRERGFALRVGRAGDGPQREGEPPRIRLVSGRS